MAESVPGSANRDARTDSERRTPLFPAPWPLPEREATRWLTTLLLDGLAGLPDLLADLPGCVLGRALDDLGRVLELVLGLLGPILDLLAHVFGPILDLLTHV